MEQRYPDLRTKLPQNLGLFYDGAFHESQSGESITITSPADGQEIAKVASAGEAQTVAALEGAQKAFETWRGLPSVERCNLLRKAAQIIRDHNEELAMLDAWNIGSPVSIMMAEVEYAAMNLDMIAGLALAVTGDTHNLTSDMLHYTLREPLGVVARIVAYNHPLLMIVVKLLFPIAVGNTVVLKTSIQAPLSALRLMELLGPVFPKGVINVLNGGKECGEILSSHPIVQRVTLVGSVPIGRTIAKNAAESLKLTTLELGGKNALVAYADADIPKLVDGIVKGMNWGWCGQSCSSTSRVFLHESIHDKVLDAVVKQIQEDYQPGDPLDKKTTMGALVDQKAIDRVQKYIDIGKQGGAKLALEGKRVSPVAGGCFITPTVFSDVQQSMRIAQEEIFGPLMCVLKWNDEDTMWKEVNSVEYGLTGAIYSSNAATAHKAAKKMEAGYVWVNTSGTHFLGIPFGGYKQSGKGREHSLDELYDMTQCKAVHVCL